MDAGSTGKTNWLMHSSDHTRPISKFYETLENLSYGSIHRPIMSTRQMSAIASYRHTTDSRNQIVMKIKIKRYQKPWKLWTGPIWSNPKCPGRSVRFFSRWPSVFREVPLRAANQSLTLESRHMPWDNQDVFPYFRSSNHIESLCANSSNSPTVFFVLDSPNHHTCMYISIQLI